MRISIIVPTQLYKYKFPAPLSMSDFPVGLAYIAGALKAAGHEVFGCNPNNLYDFASAKEMATDTITRHLDQYKPEVVCTGGICTDYAFLRDCLRTVRKRLPNTPIILGGGIVSYDPRFVFEFLKPDFAVKGDGEHIVTQIVSSISSGTDLGQIPNIFYWKDGQVQATPENFCYPDIETLTYPNFDVFDADNMMDNFSLGARALYRYPHAEPRPWVVVAGRGCPFRCTFCVHDRPTPYHTRSSADVMKELAYFHDKYRFNILVILDELFAPKRDRLVEFSAAIKKLRQERKWDLKWCFQTHANVGLTQEDIMTAKDAGCYAFSYGMESASETVLTSMKKKSHPRQIAEVIPMCYKAGVGFGGNFIFGDPAETPQTMKETMSFFRERCENLHMSLGSIQPYPGSTLYVNCLKDKTIPDAGQFYETIDEHRYRMTPGFPERPWVIWCGLIGFFGGKGLWHKAVLVPAVGQYIALGRGGGFGGGGGGGAGFPGSLMGIIAYIRQLYLDAEHYTLVKEAYARDPRSMARPEYDRALEGVLESKRILLPANRLVEIDRMIRFAAELKQPAILYGMQEAFRPEAVDLLKKANAPVLVSLRWPEAPTDPGPDDVESFRTVNTRDKAPAAPAALKKAGVPFAFYSDSLDQPRDLQRAVKRAIDAGLTRDDALRALTLSPAEIYGVADRLGSLEKGKIANLVVTRGDLFEDNTKVEMVFVDGVKYTPPPDTAPAGGRGGRGAAAQNPGGYR